MEYMKWIKKCSVISVTDRRLRGMYREHGCLRKDGETARLQDQLVGAMIGLARAAEGVECPGDRVYRTVIEGLFTTLTNVSFDDDAIRAQIEKTHREKERLLAAPVKKSAGPAKRQRESQVRQQVCKIRMIIISVCCGTWTLISAP